MVSTLEQRQVPNGTGPGVRSKRPLYRDKILTDKMKQTIEKDKLVFSKQAGTEQNSEKWTQSISWFPVGSFKDWCDKCCIMFKSTVRLGYCFTPYQRLYNGAPLVVFYDTLGIRSTYSRLNPRRPHGGSRVRRWMVMTPRMTPETTRR